MFLSPSNERCRSDDILLIILMVSSRDGRLGSKMGQIGPKWLIKPNVLKSDLKKSRICPIWGPIWPTLEPNLPYLGWWEIEWKRFQQLCFRTSEVKSLDSFKIPLSRCFCVQYGKLLAFYDVIWSGSYYCSPIPHYWWW